jgi:hypothetical protein
MYECAYASGSWCAERHCAETVGKRLACVFVLLRSVLAVVMLFCLDCCCEICLNHCIDCAMYIESATQTDRVVEPPPATNKEAAMASQFKDYVQLKKEIMSLKLQVSQSVSQSVSHSALIHSVSTASAVYL